jgi:hypothetical protein
MKWLRRRHDGGSATVEPTTDAPPCEHLVLIPRWDNVDDIGREDRVAGERCEACGADFTPEEAAHLRATEASRLQRRIAS